MQQKIATVFVILLSLGLLAVVIISSKRELSQGSSTVVTPIPTKTTDSQPSQIEDLGPIDAADLGEVIFFYGNTCPHCLETEQWIADKGIEKVLPITKKEVYDNQTNARELGQVAKTCGLDTNSIGVPFLFAQGQCYIGSDKIEAYLTQVTGLGQSSPEATMPAEF